MAEINYIAQRIGEGTTVTTTRRVYNDRTREYDDVQRTYQIDSVAEDGTLNLVPCNETFTYNNAQYAVQYVGPRRR